MKPYSTTLNRVVAHGSLCSPGGSTDDSASNSARIIVDSNRRPSSLANGIFAGGDGETASLPRGSLVNTSDILSLSISDHLDSMPDTDILARDWMTQSWAAIYQGPSSAETRLCGCARRRLLCQRLGTDCSNSECAPPMVNPLIHTFIAEQRLDGPTVAVGLHSVRVHASTLVMTLLDVDEQFPEGDVVDIQILRDSS